MTDTTMTLLNVKKLELSILSKPGYSTWPGFHHSCNPKAKQANLIESWCIAHWPSWQVIFCCHHHYPLVGVWSLRDERGASFYIRFHPFSAWSLPPDFHICSPSSPSPSPSASRSLTFCHHPLLPILLSSCDSLRRVVITLYQVGIHVCKSNVHHIVCQQRCTDLTLDQ